MKQRGEALLACGEDYELIIVDDSSPDGTAEEVGRLQEKRPWLRLMCRSAEDDLRRVCKELPIKSYVCHPTIQIGSEVLLFLGVSSTRDGRGIAGTHCEIHARPTTPRRSEDKMSYIQLVTRRFGIAGELMAFFWGNKRWWMIPIVFVLLLFGVLMVLAQSSAVGPFIYTLF